MTDRSPVVRRAGLLLCLTVALACDERMPTTVPTRSPLDLHPYVTGDAAAALTPDGQFQDALLTRSTESGVMDAEQAAKLAQSYVRTYGRSFEGVWHEQRGAAINLANLSVTRVAFASTPYVELPNDVHPGLRNAFGSYYLVTFSENGTPTLLVSVAAKSLATVGEDGLLVLPRLGGNAFRGQGIPARTVNHGLQFLSPEEAVEQVARPTGAKATKVPDLLLLSADSAPVTAVWKISLDRPVAVNSRGVPSATTSLFITKDVDNPRVVANAIQPAFETFPLLFVNSDGTHRGPVNTDIRLREGRAVRYNSVKLSQEVAP